MYTDEQFEKLEQEELEITKKALIVMSQLIDSFGDSLIKELRNFYQQYGKDGVVTYSEARKWVSKSDHRRRITVLMLLVSERTAALSSELEKEFEKFLTEVIGKENQFFDTDIGVDEVLLTIWGADKLHWLSRLRDDILLWQYQLEKEIKQTILQQRKLNVAIAILLQKYESMKSVLQRLGITESTVIGSATRAKIFALLGIAEYRFYTQADERTCDICGSMHGLIFPLSAYEIGVTASPLHPRCRCFEVPIIP